MLITETQLRQIIQRSILLEEKEKQGLENNEELSAVEDELEEIPASFFSKLEKVVEKDVENIEEQPAGDEGLFVLGAAALISGPIILKGFKWIAKKLAAGLQKVGLNDAGEDVWWTGLDMDDHNCWYHKWHHFYQDNCEAFGELILKLFGNENPSDEQIKQAGNVVFLVCVIIMATMSGAGALHALHEHHLWLTCGEAIMTCIESAEVVELLGIVAAVALGKSLQDHAEEHGYGGTPQSLQSDS